MANPEPGGSVLSETESAKLNSLRSSTENTLYKYTDPKYIQSCVENGVFASNIKGLNDPFEAADVEYADSYRVVCLTTSYKKMLMWAYYGNHQGCCIEYEIAPEVIRSGVLKKVNYVKEFISHDNMDSNELLTALYNKSDEWKHENERRAVWDAGLTYPDGVWNIDDPNDPSVVYLNARVKAVTFGVAAISNPNYQTGLEYLLNYNKAHKEQIKIHKCKCSRKTYRLEYDSQFDPNKELRRLKKMGINNNEKNKVNVRHEVYDFGFEDEDEDGNSTLVGDNYNGEFIPTDTALLLVYAAVGDGQILKIQTLGTNPEISADGKQFMADNSHRESARWQEALDNLIRWGWVKPEGYKGEVYSVTGTGYKRSDWLRENMSIDTSKDPLEERKKFDD